MNEQKSEINLTPKEEAELLEKHRRLKEKRKAYRINVIILHYKKSNHFLMDERLYQSLKQVNTGLF